ncbi:MAG: hypothetical protein D8M58_15210 [Calditrichaeota bacterium]|nr:MAG: hypothetical protein DWQ03_16450 [Calditrichota bacterium]MBL1206752.1 hypothetical protein [Calditrichota bacterium]NOG46578.1 hypothetical protein [Calditrichota bacterium]
MKGSLKQQIQYLVDLETEGWNTKNPDLFVSIIHPDMVWPWPPTANAHDPVDWVFVMGRFNKERWTAGWQELFDTHDLIHNNRTIKKIEITEEEDGAFAVVDIDTLWRNKKTKENSLWKGRVCKIYTKMPNGEWKLISHTGALEY